MLIIRTIFTSIAFCMVLAVVQGRFAYADPVCDSLATQPRGLYMSQPDGTVQDLKKPIPYSAGARLYYVTGESPLAASKEAAWHIRSQTVSLTDSRSDRAFVYRPAQRTMCRSGRLGTRTEGDFFDEFQPAERIVPLNRYIDYHSETVGEQRQDFGLKTYFHFQVSNSETGRCFRTDDFAAVGSLRQTYGFSDVDRVANRLTKWTSLVTQANAAVVSRRYAGLSSEFAYLSGPTPSCFGFNMPVQTKAGGWGFFGAATPDWQPDVTEIVIRRLPRGAPVTLKITWQH